MERSKKSRYAPILVKRDVWRRLYIVVGRMEAERGDDGRGRIGCGTVIERMLDAQYPETRLTEEEACHQ